MKKVALITGVTGQDGACPVGFHLQKGYIVHGVKRRYSNFNTARIDRLIEVFTPIECVFHFHHGDTTDS